MPCTVFNLTICGVDELYELATQPVTHLISIWHQQANRDDYTAGVSALFPNAKILFLAFDDIEEGYDETDRPPNVDHIRDLLAFGKTFTDDSVVGIHCMAGISRSTATAIAILTDHLGPGSELDVAEHIKAIRPQASPNRLILRLVDEILERNNALVSATDATFGASGQTRNKGW